MTDPYHRLGRNDETSNHPPRIIIKFEGRLDKKAEEADKKLVPNKAHEPSDGHRSQH